MFGLLFSSPALTGHRNGDSMSNLIRWFEIPVHNWRRAKEFYEAVLQRSIAEFPVGTGLMGQLGAFTDDVQGAIVKHEFYRPSNDGVLVYFDGGDDLLPFLGRVEAAGGRVLIDKTLIADDIGYYAVFADPDGNRLGVMSSR